MAEDEEPNNGERDPAHKQIQGITDNCIEVSFGGNLVSVSIDAFILYLYTLYMPVLYLEGNPTPTHTSDNIEEYILRKVYST